MSPSATRPSKALRKRLKIRQRAAEKAYVTIGIGSLEIEDGNQAIVLHSEQTGNRLYDSAAGTKISHIALGSSHGWLIFKLPPAEIAVHPSEKNDLHEFYFLCDDIEAFIADMTEKGVPCSDIHEEMWGRLIAITLPGGGKIGVYEPKHASPLE